MIDSLVQQFTSGGHESMGSEELTGAVGQMFGGAPQQHGQSAISEALGMLGGGGFGQSVMQGSANAGQEERNGLGSLFMNAISNGGGSPGNALSQLGVGSSNFSPQELGTLAEYVGTNHPSALSGVLGGMLGGDSSGGGGGGSMLKLLGNPMVRQVGLQLAKKLM